MTAGCLPLQQSRQRSSSASSSSTSSSSTGQQYKSGTAHLVGVHGPVRLLLEDVAHHLVHLRGRGEERSPGEGSAAAARSAPQQKQEKDYRLCCNAALAPGSQNLLELLAFCPPISAHLGHAGHASHQQHLLDVCGVDPRVLHAAVAGLHRAVQQPLDQLLKLGAAGGAGQGKQEAGQGRSEWRCVGRKAGRQRGSSTSLHAGKQAIPAGPRSPRLTG